MIIADGYTLKDSAYTVPDAPGMGIAIDEKIYKQKYQSKENVVS